MKTDKSKPKRRAQPSLLLKKMEAETEQSKESKIARMIEIKVEQAVRLIVDKPPA